MYLNRLRQHPILKGHHDLTTASILYNLKWNILPVVVMLILLVWVSLQVGKMIEESKQSTDQSVGFVG